ncbi:SGNH/GDSL hydrolase family protein [Flavobacterium algicola]|uniref:SGNH/GDSL hydrolase family protein n=1 Tax=Flavobacterium algicola TaxID=556529 RepID=UPI001EFE92FF|nr:SGNH/GDSL hydrolase family protein [Flavobacterium algicola]MCG9791667.1 SGNH/GDSL hydrolase family protein [Flavobacterium algicola]
MKKTFILIVTVALVFLLLNCTAESSAIKDTSKSPFSSNQNLTYLALGDSYTIGQGVCSNCSFPLQLKQKLATTCNQFQQIDADIIAKTGWTSTQLLAAISNQKPHTNYDMVTLLIGVNNQFQNFDFKIFEKDFPQLIKQSIAFAKGDKKKVIVLSIPDYTFTPFGQDYTNSTNTSLAIDRYNSFAEKYCRENGIAYISITDISRDGIRNPYLVTYDGLHPSEAAYTLFVERLLPKALIALNTKKSN